jgi:phosphate starvation-inducible protein PhoH/3-hydroxyacyl-CoA dehydrogenase
MAIHKVGVLGCGLMGSGIAEVAARAGLTTVVREVDQRLLDKGLGRIQGSLGKAVERGKLAAEDRDATLGRLHGTTGFDDLADCDLVVEAIVENVDEKRKTFGALDAAVKPEAIFASNTSSLTITQLAMATKRPDRFVGLHFFNPVPVMKLVEVVRTILTSNEAYDAAFAFARAVGKEPIACRDNSGFVVNRLLVPYLLDAIRALEEGVGSVEDIDKGMQLGCGYPMGPFTLLDFVGLDTTYYIANIMFEEYREKRFAPPPLLKQMVTAGRLGKKSGRGYSDHTTKKRGGRVPPPWEGGRLDQGGGQEGGVQAGQAPRNPGLVNYPPRAAPAFGGRSLPHDPETYCKMTQVTLAEEGLDTLFGTHDENLRRIERTFDVTVTARGNELNLQGDPERVAVVEHLLLELRTVHERGYRFRPGDVQTAIRVVSEVPGSSLVEFFLPEGMLASVRRLVAPRSFKQQLYLQAMVDYDIVISIGPAGTGKTYLAVAMAAASLLEKRVRRIVLARPAVEAGEKLGFLPGDLAEKVNPYLRPLHDALHDIIGYEKVGRMMERGIIEVAPIAFMRGRTLNDSFIILDEAQNTTPEQMKMFLTRIGFNSKAVVNGDITQIDLPQGRMSGLREAQEVLAGIEGIKFFRFDKSDVVRHSLVQQIVSAYDRRDEERLEAEARAERPAPISPTLPISPAVSPVPPIEEPALP